MKQEEARDMQGRKRIVHPGEARERFASVTQQVRPNKNEHPNKNEAVLPNRRSYSN